MNAKPENIAVTTPKLSPNCPDLLTNELSIGFVVINKIEAQIANRI